MRIKFDKTFEEIVSPENLLEAWREFVRGKRGRIDVQEFSLRLIDNILELHRDLIQRTYKHGPYQVFKICDPKPRQIHKAAVRDRLVHHALYRKLYPFFDQTFVSDSYSCRKNRGTHKALNRFREFSYIVSKNNTHTCWVLKCDVKKFFASIDHKVLLAILRKRIADEDVLWLLGEIVGSFHSGNTGVGLPLGNLTSQLLVNVYMNEFDRFVKHKLRTKYYIRYADDFVLLSNEKQQLEETIKPIRTFLADTLKLTAHKVHIKTMASGVDFLGWVHFPDHRVLRTTTKNRMIKRIKEYPMTETLNSYLGLLGHGNTRKLRQKLLTSFYV